MGNKRVRRLVAAAAVPVIGLAATACQGPNSATQSYLTPSADGVQLTSLLTVGDGKAADNEYQTVGIPDGLGATLDQNGKVKGPVTAEAAGSGSCPTPTSRTRASVARSPWCSTAPSPST